MNKKQLLILPALFLSLLISSTACFKMNNADLIRRAEQGDASAQLELAIKYRYGERDDQQSYLPTLREGSYYVGKYQDHIEAVKWYRKAAEQGLAAAQYGLGIMYYHGNGVSQDYKEAMKWWRLAAKQGDADAQFRLGWMYRKGLGVTQNSTEAAKWYRLAAEQGDAAAQNNLGIMYSHGNGVSQDYKEAMKWWRLAAKQGNADAQYSLGMMYKEGKGIAKDHIRAYMWMILSIKNGGRASFARERDSLIKKMTPAQIEEAKKLARMCEARNYKYYPGRSC